MSAIVLTFDLARRRRPTASCVTPAERRRIDHQMTLARLELERSELRERLRHVPDTSELRVHLLLDATLLNADIETLERLLAPAEVVPIRRAR